MTVPTYTIPCFTVAGALQIWCGTGASAAMEFLGLTARGATINEHSYQRDLKSDRLGGDAGPPADFLHLGRHDIIEFELAEYNETILAKLEKRANASVTIDPGTLLGCAGAYFRFAFLATNFLRNYTRVYINQPIVRAPVGLAEMMPRLTLDALMDPTNVAGTLGAPVNQSPWNTSVSVSGSTVT